MLTQYETFFFFFLVVTTTRISIFYGKFGLGSVLLSLISRWLSFHRCFLFERKVDQTKVIFMP